MSLGLQLRGRRAASDPEAFLARVAHWIEARQGDPPPEVRLEAEGPERFVAAELHPCAEPILIEAPSPDTVVLTASTGTAGPGYHRHACEVALAMGDALGISWELDGDETGWMRDRDDAALQRAFTDWLGAVARRVLELAEEGMRGFSLFLPAGHHFEQRGFVLTQLGPRDEAWLRAVAADPSRGVEVFPWWEHAQDGRYFLNLALARMWLDVRWRPPLDEQERALSTSITTWIERAHALDASLPIPWHEQSEILTLLDEDSLRATRAHVQAQAPRPTTPIGYRRGMVRVTLSGGWSMRVPGELAERWEERGTWVGWDERRSVWFTSMTVQRDDGTLSPSTEATLASLPPLSGDDLLELERGELRGLASFVEDEQDGRPIYRLEAHAASGANAAIGTLVFVDEADREWALSTWGSLAHTAD